MSVAVPRVLVSMSAAEAAGRRAGMTLTTTGRVQRGYLVWRLAQCVAGDAVS